MKPSVRTYLLMGVLLCGLGAPRAAHAVNGCNNAFLYGAYNAQVSSANINGIINAALGSDSPDSLALGTNPSSLSGSVPALGRYYFDRNGNVFGLAPKATTSNPLVGVLGTYSINSDCSGKITLTGGRTFDIVVSSSGDRAVFLETDAKGGGAVGQLVHTNNSCVAPSAASYSYSVSGGVMVAAVTSADGTVTPSSTQAYSAIGILTIDGSGHFKMSQSAYVGGKYQTQTAGGSYSAGTNCSLQLTFNTTGNTGGFTAPAGFSGLLNETNSRASSNSAGLFVLQPVSGQVLTGQVFVQ